jgi:TetR/AcrR family transcriptional regulator, cholesterol catabolism regulator
LKNGRSVSQSRKRGSYSPETTRSDIMSAALELFSEAGYHATTVQEVVDRSAVTKGAFYYHFDNKEDLLRQIHAEYATELLKSARMVSETVVSPLEQLRMLIQNAVVLFARYRLHVTVFYQEFRFLSGTNYAAIRRMHDDEEAILLDIVARGKAAGQLRDDVDTKLLVFAISGITAWIYQWYQPKGPMAIEDIAEGLAEIILVGCISQATRTV